MNTVKKNFPVLGMTCASCVISSQSILENQPGVIHAAVNYANSTAQIDYDPAITGPDKFRVALQSIGYDLMTDETEEGRDNAEELQKQHFGSLKRRTTGAVLLSVPIVLIGMFFPGIPYADYIMWALATPVVLLFGRQFFRNAWKQARHLSANMDTLVALSTGIAYLFSVFSSLDPQYWYDRGVQPPIYFEASAVVIAFILLGKLLEERAKRNTSSALKKLIGLQPRSVTLVDEAGRQTETPMALVKIGDTVLVRPGEMIAVDGAVHSGNSFVDESMISGEPVAVEKALNDKVYAGTLNQKGSFQFVAEKVGGDTVLAQIIKKVQEAQGSKAPVQKLVDRIAGIFVPVVILIATASLLAWIIWGGNNGFTHGLLALVTVLIIACPCALGLATPTAVMAGIGKGAENGILIKDAESLELTRKINVVVLDKTGTITEGRPVVTNIFWLKDDPAGIQALASLENQSEHPLAAPVVTHLGKMDFLPVLHFEGLPGFGAKGVIAGKVFFVGSASLLANNDISVAPPLRDAAAKWAGEAKTVIYFANEGAALAVIAIADKVKETSRRAIQQLQEAGIGVYMLTGDNPGTAAAIAGQVGITQFKAGMLPGQKADFVKELQRQGKMVAMVGDGINDSNALAQADVSIAMGKGSDLAMDVAKMTIISSDLLKIPQAIQLSKYTVAAIRQNLFWASIYNIVAIPVAAGILYPVNGFLLNPMLAGAAMALSSISVVGNSLRLKVKKLSNNKSNMEVLQFRTNINCSGCVARVTPVLNEVAGTNNWQVDTQAPGKTLTVSGDRPDEARIKKVLEKEGFMAERFPLSEE